MRNQASQPASQPALDSRLHGVHVRQWPRLELWAGQL
jgi:hypothetical protein